MRPLRAYLLTKLSPSDWDVSTHRDLETIEAAWRACPIKEAAAAVHVGFWRPSTQAFSEILAAHPGRILLTGAARYALPISFRASSMPVGEVEGLPLFLALCGWGYDADDPTAAATAIPTRERPAATYADPSLFTLPSANLGWISHLTSVHSDLYASAVEYGVVDEASYLCQEGKLPVWMRHRLGDVRFRWYCKDELTPDNILDHVAFAPPWFLKLPIGILSLSTRPRNVMAERAIVKIGDLAKYDTSQVSLFEKMGQKSVREIGERLLAILSGGVAHPLVVTTLNLDSLHRPLFASDVEPSLNVAIFEESQKAPEDVQDISYSAMSFSNALELALALLPERARPVMEMRMGIKGTPMTLGDIGAACGVTRERIRQIESKSVEKIRALPCWTAGFGFRLREILNERDDALPLAGIEVIDPVFKGAGSAPDAFEYALERFIEPPLYVVREGGIAYVSELRQQEWFDVIRSAKSLIESLLDKQPTELEVRNLLDGLLTEVGMELRDELWHIATRQAHFANGKLVSYGYGAENLVLAILEASDRPLHYSEILDRLRANGETRLDWRTVHNAAISVALPYARGTYGTMKHYPLNEAETRLIISETEDLIEGEGSERQWHAREICDYLEERGLGCAGQLTHYIVSIAVKRSPYLAYLGRMIWTSKSNGTKGKANRVDLYQAVVSILLEAGGPLTSVEIKERLFSDRGTNCFFQIQPEGKLLRVGSGRWGLIDRDLPFSQEESERVLVAMRDALLTKGKGIHVTEIIEEVAKYEPIVIRIEDPVLLFGLSQKTDGFALSKGEHIYLPEWNDPKRLNMREAVLEVLEEAGPEGILATDGTARAEELLERPFPKHFFFGQYSYHLGAIYNEVTKRWRLPTLIEKEEIVNSD